MSDVTDADHLPDDASAEEPPAVFGYEEFWPKVYGQYKRRFDAVNDLIRLGDEIV
jgi:hypothetical protein